MFSPSWQASSDIQYYPFILYILTSYLGLRLSMRPQYKPPVKKKYVHTRPKLGKNEMAALKMRQESLRRKTLSRRNRILDR
jgi:hypothetical protein